MFESDLHEVVSGYIPHFHEEYKENSCSSNQRNGYSLQTWQNGSHLQKYSGEFLRDSLHGLGTYTWLRPSQSYMYEGGLYASNFEGYANLVRTDGQYFEGLLKSNRKFGPGVSTYTDGRQDVGLWDGPKLHRLACVVLPQWVPRLARSPLGKVKLLKFRSLVQICPRFEEDEAKAALRDLGAHSKLLEESDRLYNNCVRHPRSKLFNKNLHNDCFFGERDCTIEVADDSKNFHCDAAYSLISDGDLTEKVGDTGADIYENFRVPSDEKFVKFLMDALVENVADLAILQKDERVLIFNKITITKKILEPPKYARMLSTKKVEVNELLAWNNEKVSIEMMRHVFLHRNMESHVSFKVAKLLAGDRSAFNRCGDHEMASILFLANCSAGNDEIIDGMLLSDEFHYNLCDANGNAGILFAAARDRWSTIIKLTNFGVNLDVVNDEGLTPLTMCLLRYLATKNSVGNWEGAFLSDTIVSPEEELQIRTEWRPHVSLTNLNSASTLYETYAQSEKDLEKLMSHLAPNSFQIQKEEDDSNDYLAYLHDKIGDVDFDMDFKNFQEPYTERDDDETQTYVFKTNCDMSVIQNAAEASKKSTSRNEHEKEQIQIQSKTAADFIIINKLKIIFATVKMLLSCGADPNIGIAPVPALIMCLFCGNEELLRLLLKSSADANIVTMDGNLSPLHILASLPFSEGNLEMLTVLLEQGANPNCKTNAYHWIEEKTKLIGKRNLLGLDDGKTPLHVLCMRYDFNSDAQNILSRMVRIFIDFSANTSKKYLGHTPFSLAVLRGNLKLLKFFLSTSAVDPNEKLGEDMGVALTVPILKRYVDVMHSQTTADVYDLLMEYNVNPLSDIDGLINAVEFMYKEHESEAKLPSTSSNSTGRKLLSEGKKSQANEIKDHLLRCARKMLERHTQYEAFKYLTYFVLENTDLDDEVVVTLTKFLTLADTERIIQILLRKRILLPNYATRNLCLQVLNLVKDINISSKKGKSAADRRKPTEVLDSLDLDAIDSTNKFGLIEPEADPNKDKYKVCYYCGRKTGMTLIACPKCGLVYFCSQECNVLSVKKQDYSHRCCFLFYDTESERRGEANDGERMFPSKLEEKLWGIKRLVLLRSPGGIDDDEDFDLLQTGARKGKYVNTFGEQESIRAFGIECDSEKGVSEKQTIASADSPDAEERDDGASSIWSEQRKDRTRKVSKRQIDFSRVGERSMGREKTRNDVSQAEERGKRRGKIQGDVSQAEERGKRREKRRGDVSQAEERSKRREKIQGDVSQAEERVKGKGKRQSDLSPVEGKGKSENDFFPAGGKGKRRIDFSKTEKSGKDRSLASSEKYYKNIKTGLPGIGSKEIAKFHRDATKTLNMISNKDRRKSVGEKKLDNIRGLGLGRQGLSFKDEEKSRDGTRTQGLAPDNFAAHPHVRLSGKYQKWLEKLSELFPDFDICKLFLPFACFVDGQLYYRFLDEKPLFCLTYSGV